MTQNNRLLIKIPDENMGRTREFGRVILSFLHHFGNVTFVRVEEKDYQVFVDGVLKGSGRSPETAAHRALDSLAEDQPGEESTKTD